MARLIIDDSLLKQEQRKQWKQLLHACIALTGISVLLTLPTVFLWSLSMVWASVVVLLLAYASCWIQNPTNNLLRQWRAGLAVLLTVFPAMLCSLCSLCVVPLFFKICNLPSYDDGDSSNDETSHNTGDDDFSVCQHREWFLACCMLSSVTWYVDGMWLYRLCLALAPSNELDDDAMAETVADEEEEEEEEDDDELAGLEGGRDERVLEC